MHKRAPVLEVHLHSVNIRIVAYDLRVEQSTPVPGLYIERNCFGERFTVRLYGNLCGKILVDWLGRAIGFESLQCETTVWTI